MEESIAHVLQDLQDLQEAAGEPLQCVFPMPETEEMWQSAEEIVDMHTPRGARLAKASMPRCSEALNVSSADIEARWPGSPTACEVKQLLNRRPPWRCRVSGQS